MATKVIMPKMGYDMEQGKIVRWLKNEGDPVHHGEDIAEIETEKVNIAIQAYGEGVLRAKLVQEGESVPVGEMIAVIGAPDEKFDLEALRAQPLGAEGGEEGMLGGGEGSEAIPERKPAGAQAVAVSAGTPAAPGAEAPPHPEPESAIKASPLARRLAEEKHIDLSKIIGSGPGGRIVREDVERAAAIPAHLKTPAEELVEIRAPSALPPMRQAIARRMAQSKREAPHFYVTIPVLMDEALRLRAQINAAAGEETKVSVNDMIIKAAALTLEAHREFNALVREDRIESRDAVNIAIAIALPEGLVAPALMHCEGKSLAQIARATKDLVARAKSGALTAEEYGEGTFTVSNLGMFAVEEFAAIISPPQVAILAVGAALPTPVVRDGQITAAQVMRVTLSADHRAVDGVLAARFLQDMKSKLEQPLGLLL